jgi:hypothetical protein
MEKERSDLDNLFRKNISDYELSEEKGNWDLLNHLLNEQERKKKNRKLIFFFFSFLLVLTAGLFVFLPSDEKKENTSTTNENSNSNTTITESPPVLSSPSGTDSLKNKVQEAEHPPENDCRVCEVFKKRGRCVGSDQ